MNKSLKFLIPILFTASLFFISCEGDDTVANQQLTETPTGVSIALAPEDTSITTVFEGETIALNVQLSSSLPYDLTVDLQAVNASGESLNEQLSNLSTVIPSSSTTASISATIVEDDIAEAQQQYIFTIANAQATEGNYSNANYLTGGQTYIVNVRDVPDATLTSTEGNFVVTLNWTGTEDLDLYLRDEPGFTPGNPNIDTSWFSRPETMSNDLPDGVYYVGYDFFQGDEDVTVPCELTFSFPDGQSALILEEMQVGEPLSGWVEVIKSTNGSEVTYSYLKL